MKDLNFYAGFSAWHPLSECQGSKEKCLGKPGVYVIAAEPQTGQAFSPSTQLIYVGETCGQKLSQRLKQFWLSATGERKRHSGGWSYMQVSGKSMSLSTEKDALVWATLPENLKVSFWPVETESPDMTTATIRLTERVLIYQHLKAHGYTPVCNRK